MNPFHPLFLAFVVFVPTTYATLPKEVLNIPARLFSEPGNIYRAGNGCPIALAQFNARSAFREEILAEANRIGREAFGPHSTPLITQLGPLGPDRVHPGVLADALEDDGLTLFGERLRQGLIMPLYLTRNYAEERRFERLQNFFYLLKLNQLPASLYSRPLGQAELYFVNDILWGASLNFANFWAARGALAKHPTFEHLQVEIRPTDLVRLVNSKAMEKLTSLDLVLDGSDPFPIIPEPFLQSLVDKKRFRNLRRLRFLGNIGHGRDDIFAAPLFRLFRSAVSLEHLRLHNLVIDKIDAPEILRKLKSLEVEDVVPTYGDSRQQLAALRTFFAAVNPELHSLTLRNTIFDPLSGNVGKVLHDAAPAFVGLNDFDLDLQEIPPGQWAWLAQNPSLWRSLKTFRGTVQSARFPDTLIASLNRVLRHADRLTSLQLREAKFPANLIPELFANVKAPVETLQVGISLFDVAAHDAIVAAFPDVTALTFPGTRVELEDARRLAERLIRLRKLSVAWPNDVHVAGRMMDALRAINVDVVWRNGQ